jgi:hypothetical protein
MHNDGDCLEHQILPALLAEIERLHHDAKQNFEMAEMNARQYNEALLLLNKVEADLAKKDKRLVDLQQFCEIQRDELLKLETDLAKRDALLKEVVEICRISVIALEGLHPIMNPDELRILLTKKLRLKVG